MKTTHILSAALLAALSLASCGSDDTAVEAPQGSLRFNIGLADTRASHEDASTINSIYVNCLYDGTQLMSGGFAKLPVSGGVASARPDDMEWLGHNGIMEIDALAFNDGILTTTADGRADFTIETAQTAESLNSDLLFCIRRGTFAEISRNGTVDLDFRHALAELTINVRGASPQKPVVSGIRIGGTHHRATAVFADGSLTFDTTVPAGASVQDYCADIIPYEVASPEEGTVSYRCILIPQTAGLLEISFDSDGMPYRFVKSDAVFTSDTRHTINIDAVAGGIKTTAPSRWGTAR